MKNSEYYCQMWAYEIVVQSALNRNSDDAKTSQNKAVDETSRTQVLALSFRSANVKSSSSFEADQPVAIGLLEWHGENLKVGTTLSAYSMAQYSGWLRCLPATESKI